MALTKINGNNIDTTTEALIKVLQLSGNGAYLKLPQYASQSAINSAIPSPAFGTIVFNNEEDAAQIYVADASQGNAGWTSVGGGGPSIGENSVIRTSQNFIESSVNIGSTSNGGVEFANAFSIGPITINSGVTVGMDNGSEWTIIGTNQYSSYRN
ncbi:hypothetical protein CYXG_00017 [Synechococcus phage S-SSM4]|uniref:Uncharacterized protein n=1 Tax=Synechococcus phage S-SSM4 TaxID=536466 RepID=M1U9A6_9CAUD|nr:hypothetical protein CYXG_00017 [Synechococcus phage S-SSM4]AGG54081.1 hypothetical protein CYXG_00017 [Synechococcus phage S-SSM4]AGG54342.1 hypothetical protein CYWG_00058 [Cyanophage S-SSM6b]